MLTDNDIDANGIENSFNKVYASAISKQIWSCKNTTKRIDQNRNGLLIMLIMRDYSSDQNASGMLCTDLFLSFCIFRHF